MTEERLQKIIARSGLCSRREADQMIADGRVTVDGQPAVVGAQVDPAHHHIKVDGKTLKPAQHLRYLLLYKPREVMTTCADPEGRKTVLDLVSVQIRERIYPVGRLDYHSEGLILLTNDGDLAARVTHPRFGVVREYMVKIRGDLSTAEYHRLMRGTQIEGQHVKPRKAVRERVLRGGASSWWRVEVTEGRTHEVRELFFRAGHHVQRLRRTAIGPLRDTSLKPGDFRDLTAAEVKRLRAATQAGKQRAAGKPRPKRSRGGGTRAGTDTKRNRR
jgi:23S rRNA pseudouridine2605 synthase